MSSPDWAGQRLSRRNLLGACIAAGTATLAGCTSGSLEAETTVNREYEGTDISEINVQGVNGDIAIRDTQRETIQLNGTKRAASEDDLERITLQADQSDDRLSLTVDTGDSGFLPFGSSPLQMDLTLTVPEGLHLTAEGMNGDVDIETSGAESVTADTTNGDITLLASELVEVQTDTTNGDISITLPATTEPAISLDTTNGDTTINGFQADLIESGSAVDRMVGNGTHRVTATTTNGDITIRGRERNE
ncbi:DUF4097 family beta strand repeat-containing protein [Halorubrum sp. SD690R]|uniref:DUF4097 family beta strand repeat-containing protein n=1 Tax=Halorubrum sp. SD690R TaxID=2518117 RepID=UPI00130507D3|nr:DUF4097 family beta strand repeat-containing protein [Halorubrum sp. SD690R]